MSGPRWHAPAPSFHRQTFGVVIPVDEVLGPFRRGSPESPSVGTGTGLIPVGRRSYQSFMCRQQSRRDKHRETAPPESRTYVGLRHTSTLFPHTLPTKVCFDTEGGGGGVCPPGVPTGVGERSTETSGRGSRTSKSGNVVRHLDFPLDLQEILCGGVGWRVLRHSRCRRLPRVCVYGRTCVVLTVGNRRVTMFKQDFNRFPVPFIGAKLLHT